MQVMPNPALRRVSLVTFSDQCSSYSEELNVTLCLDAGLPDFHLYTELINMDEIGYVLHRDLRAYPPPPPLLFGCGPTSTRQCFPNNRWANSKHATL